MTIETWKIPVTWAAEADEQPQMQLQEELKTLEDSDGTQMSDGSSVLRASTEVAAFNSTQLRETEMMKGKFILRKLIKN